MEREYKGLVFTNHALDRLTTRKVTQGEAWATWRRPRKRYYASTKGGWVFERVWGKREIEVVAKQNDRKQWVVLSVWSNYLQYKPQRLWIELLLRKLWKDITKLF